MSWGKSTHNIDVSPKITLSLFRRSGKGPNSSAENTTEANLFQPRGSGVSNRAVTQQANQARGETFTFSFKLKLIKMSFNRRTCLKNIYYTTIATNTVNIFRQLEEIRFCCVYFQAHIQVLAILEEVRKT